MKSLSVDKFELVPISELTTPKNGARVVSSHYWVVHNENVLFYRPSKAPQCNSNPEVSNYIASKLYDFDVEVRLIDVAYVKR